MVLTFLFIRLDNINRKKKWTVSFFLLRILNFSVNRLFVADRALMLNYEAS